MKASSRYRRLESRRRALKAAAARVARRSGKMGKGEPPASPPPRADAPKKKKPEPPAGKAPRKRASTGETLAWSVIVLFSLILLAAVVLFVFFVSFRR